MAHRRSRAGGARRLAALAAVTLGAGCGADLPLAGSSGRPAPPPAVIAPVARYLVTFDAGWSASTHPTDAPPQPHFSGLIGGTHREQVRFWGDGALASDGIKAMAERGRKSPLDEEVQAAIAAGTAQHVLSGGDIPLSPGSVALEFEISRDYPLVTLVSMIAPSPDWFVGVSGLSLIEGDWVAEKVVPLDAWDAGTDGGVTFLSADRPLEPREPIARIRSGPLVVGTGVPPLGRFTFRRIP